MRIDFSGRVALVTGAGSGIGRATALAFAAAGARIVVADIAADQLDETVALVEGQGGDALGVPTDAADAAAMERLVAAAIDRHGRLDCAVNNAGIGGTSRLDPWDIDHFERLMSVNTRSVFYGMKYQIAEMLRLGGGAIVNMASTAGLVGIGSYGYAASKHAVVGLTRTAALAHGRMGIRVNAVAPGAIDTPLLRRAMALADTPPAPEALNPNGRLGTAEEVADAVVWLCSDQAMMINGHVLPIDGGFVAG